MKSFFGDKLYIQKNGANYEIMVKKSWGNARAFDSLGRHETFHDKQSAKQFLRNNATILV